MKAAAPAYALQSGAEEMARLRMQASAIESDADVLLGLIGVRPGWRCLDLGCGVGGITNLLSRRVGPSGRVVGLDGDAEKLAAARVWAEANGLANVEFVEGDAYRTGLPRGSFDLVHLRFMFTTIGRHEELVAEAVALTRAGGALAVQEADVTTLACYPPHLAWDRLKEAMSKAFARVGADTYVGQRMFGMLRRAGLEEVRFRPCLVGFTDKDPMAAFVPNTAASMRRAIVDAGLMTDAELDEAIAACRRHLADPDTTSTSYVVFQVWGQKPAGRR